VLSGRGAARSDREEAGGAERERRRVEREGESRADPGDEQPAERRSGHAHREGPYGGLQGVGLDELVGGDDVGDERHERGEEERLSRAEDPRQDHQMPELDRVRRDEYGGERDDRGSRHVGDDHDRTPWEAVGERTAEQ
jgi:hypothetical protein